MSNVESSVVFPSVPWYDNSINSNVLRQSYVNGFLDISGETIFRTDASLCGNIGIGGAVSISNNIGMSGVINQLITSPLIGGYVYQQVASTDALAAIAQINALNELIIFDENSNSTYANPITGNLVTIGTTNVNVAIGGITNSVTGNLVVIKDVSLNSRLSVNNDLSLGNRLFLKSDAFMNGRLFIGGDMSVNGISIGLGSQQNNENITVGKNALHAIVTGGGSAYTNNTAVGFNALRYATTPINNTAIGSLSLSSNTTGANNTAIGFSSGAFVTTGGNLTCLGYNTGFINSITQYNKSTAIGYNATITGSNQVVLGTSAESIIMAGNVSIGKTTTPGFALDVSGKAQFTGDVSMGGSLIVNGNLSVLKYNNQYIVNQTTTNYQLIVSEDISLNGRLFTNGELRINSGTPTNTSTLTTDITTNSVTPLLNLNSFNTTGLGTTAGNFLNLLSMSYSSANTSYLNVYGLRTSAGSGWNTASTRIQHVIDSTNQAYIEFNGTNNNHGIGLYAGAGGNLSPYAGITVKNGGNVGIGTTNPSYTLDVSGSLKAVQATHDCIELFNSGETYIDFKNISTSDFGARIGFLGQTDSAYGTGRLTLTAPTITLGANVGIGTTNPNYTLDVIGNAEFTSDVSMGGRLLISGDVALTSGTTATTYMNLYGKAPPTNVYLSTVSPNATNATSSVWVNNNITWTAGSSTQLGGVFANYTSFLTGATTNGGTAASGWHSNLAYNGTTAPTGAYISSSPYYTNMTSVGTVSGEWLQIQSQVPVVLNNFYLTTTAVSNGNANWTRLPKTFYICGSNDNNTWNPIIYGNWTSSPTTSAAVLQNTNTYVIPAGTASGTLAGTTTTGPGTAVNLTYATYGNSTNAYTNFRLVVVAIISSSFSGWVAQAATDYASCFWTPKFSVPTVTGPSRTLLYMDPSNINQLDVSGSLGLVNTNASTMTVTPNTTGAALSGWQNNNITWLASASNSQSASFLPYLLFDTIVLSAGTNRWIHETTSTYNATTRSAPATYSTPIGNSVGSVNGSWVQLQSSIPVVMKNFSMSSFSLSLGGYQEMPGTFYICGSNDPTNNNNWSPLILITFTGAQFTGTTSYISPIYTIPSGTTTAASISAITTNSNGTYSTYGNGTTAYTYFRMVITQQMGTLAGAGATNDGWISFGEWTPYFTPATSSVSMALDVGLPNQLNIGGAMNVAGTLSAAGAMNVVGNLYMPGQPSIFCANNEIIAINSVNIPTYGLSWQTDTVFNSGAPTGFFSSYGGLKFQTVASTRMTITNAGNVGIGTSTPTASLTVLAQNSNGSVLGGANGANVDVLALETSGGGKWRLSMDGVANSNLYFVGLINTSSNFTTYGVVALIENDTNNPPTAKMNFTGQHRCAYDETINSVSCEGLIVNSTGEYWSLLNGFDNTSQIDHITINESLPKITLTKTSFCKSVFGVISFTEDTNKTRKFDGAGRFVSIWENPLGEAQRVFVNSLGEGGIWVCNANGIFSNGDYITSSTVPGYGMVQDNGQMMNYTVGKITSDCDFNPKELPVFKIITNTDGTTQTITAVDSFGNIITKPAYKTRYLKPDGTIISQESYNAMISNGETAYIAAFIGCTYHCG